MRLIASRGKVAVDRRFDPVDRRLDSIEHRMDEGFARFDLRFDAMQHALIYGTIALSAAIIAGFVAVALAI